RTKALFILMLGGMTLMSCKTNVTSKCGPCPLIAFFAPTINVRIVDKTTGADLFLSPNSTYKLSDLKVSSSVDGDNINVIVDSTDKANRFVRILATATQTFTIKLASLSADNVRVVLKTDSPKCCPTIKVSSITLNTTSVCGPCSNNEPVVIQK
ncbi:MAG: hypothetical protein ACXVJB_09920, partial [Mucilaginibacter sp.]